MSYGVIALFWATSFLTSFLLFSVQPMIGKWLLPLLGGAPSVWNACMVVFQATLLLGYLYAHATRLWLPIRGQLLGHALLLLTPAVFLPFAVPLARVGPPPSESSPLPWLVLTLVIMVGVPFFVISTSSPLIQTWYERVGASNPYVLYSAGNLGSLLALLSYPALVEPSFSLEEQSRLWTGGYALAVIALWGCAALVWRSNSHPSRIQQEEASSTEAPISWAQRSAWVVFAAIPSSLMLGVTTYLSTDVAAIPLLWIVPLAIYLFTFVLIFSPRPIHLPPAVQRAAALVATFLVVAMLVHATQPAWFITSAHVFVFFVAAMICHQRLATSRPAPAQLTEFYMWMSVGGVLGGAVTTFVAPLVFERAWEYPLALSLAFAVRLPAAHEQDVQSLREQGRLRVLWPWWWAIVGVITLLNLGVTSQIPALQASPLFTFALPAALVFTVVEWPRRFALSMVAMVIAGATFAGDRGRTILTERSFYGIIQVTDDPAHDLRRFFHGTTLHGMERLSAQRAGECTPLTYYSSTGPSGRFMSAWSELHPTGRVGIVGLGTGSLACYAASGQAWVFYELDPAVVAVARDPNLFTLLTHSPTSDQTFYVGDARLRLPEATPYDVLVIDAFSSDAIPVHLLTLEAFDLYLSKLQDDGILALHVSSRSFALVPVVATLARASNLEARVSTHTLLTAEEAASGASPSQWIFLARRADTLQPYDSTMDWSPPTVSGSLWTDSYSNLLETLH